MDRFRDQGLYSTRNTSKGALLPESVRILGIVDSAPKADEVRRLVLEGNVIAQQSRNTRRHIWTAINRRYIAGMPAWVLTSLNSAAAQFPNDQSFAAILLFHFCLRDRLTYDFVIEVLFDRWTHGKFNIGRDDVLSFLDVAAAENKHISKWSTSSRLKLAGNILTSLRDFNLLQGVQRKTLRVPELPPAALRHVARVLASEGLRGGSLLRVRDWRLFLRREQDIAELFAKHGAEIGVRFERAGETVIIHTPPEWTASNALV